MFVSRLCQKLCSESAIIVKGGKLTQTFHRVYMRKKPVPLSFPSKSPKEFTTNPRDKLVSSKPLIRIIETPSLESAEKPPRIRQILHHPQQVHGSRVASPQPLTAQDCCSPLGFISLIRFVRATCPGVSLTVLATGPFVFSCEALEICPVPFHGPFSLSLRALLVVDYPFSL